VVVSIAQARGYGRHLAPEGKVRSADQARIRRELEGRLAEIADLSAGRSGIETEKQADVFDEAQSMMSAELTVARLNMEWRTRNAIEAALEKLNSGEYGICESCGEPIHPKRMEAIPWAALCTSCQSVEEAGSEEQGDASFSGMLIS
jgi:DnaK suppressor protein